MARSIPVIYQQLLAEKNAQAPLISLNSTSQVSIWNLWLWITAVGQNLFEQLCDLFQVNIETMIANATVFTSQWVVQMCKLFQFSSGNPQVIQVNVSNIYPYVTLGYPVVNSTLCPVTQASAVTTSNGQLLIKVTGANGPLDGASGVTGTTCIALSSYLDLILPPNVEYTLINDVADQLFIQAQVFYNASYISVIQANMATAINNYLFSIPFNGVFTVSALEEAMLAVPGVTDIILQNVFYRTAQNIGTPSGGIPPANSYYTMQKLIFDKTLVLRNYQTYAGYVTTEQTSGYKITDPGIITYIPS